MPKLTFAGHPVHPQLISFPLGLFPFSLLMDGLYLSTGKRVYAQAAYYSLLGGYIGGLVAGMAGAADYFTIPKKTDTKRSANIHAVLNLAAIGLYTANLLLRRRSSMLSKTPIVLSALGVTGLLVSAWYGGQLVYHYGMRVKGVSPVASAREIAILGDEKQEDRAKELQQIP